MTTKEQKRDYMRRARADPVKGERIRLQHRQCYWNGARDQYKSYYAKLRAEHFFIWRARIWSARHGVRVTGLQLWHVWKQQGGRCALSGLKLRDDAHLDHIIPDSQGGSADVTNLRWLDPRVNVARGNLADAEFVAMCKAVAEH
jgi:5-methylcytosine-specific restriction endonuclease McrA